MPQHPAATLDLPGGARLTLASLDDLASPQVLKVLELMAARVNAPAAAGAPSAYPPAPAPAGAPAPTYAPIEPYQGKPPLVLVGVPWEWRDGPPLGAWVAACYAKEGWPFGGSTRKVYGALVSPSSVHPGWDGRFIGVNGEGFTKPSVRTLCAITRLSSSTVKRAMSELMARQYVRRTRRGGYNRGPSWYHLPDVERFAKRALEAEQEVNARDHRAHVPAEQGVNKVSATAHPENRRISPGQAAVTGVGGAEWPSPWRHQVTTGHEQQLTEALKGEPLRDHESSLESSLVNKDEDSGEDSGVSKGSGEGSGKGSGGRRAGLGLGFGHGFDYAPNPTVHEGPARMEPEARRGFVY